MINSGVRHDENLHNYGQNLQGQKKHKVQKKNLLCTWILNRIETKI